MAELPIRDPDACAVRERTADGVSVGRCWFKLENGVCPRHGDVREVQKNFKATGRLTDENDLKLVQAMGWQKLKATGRSMADKRDMEAREVVCVEDLDLSRAIVTCDHTNNSKEDAEEGKVTVDVFIPFKRGKE
jgi:hypothetical protein